MKIRDSIDYVRWMLLIFAVFLLVIAVWDFKSNQENLKSRLTSNSLVNNNENSFLDLVQRLNPLRNFDKFIEKDMVKNSLITKSTGEQYDKYLGAQFGEISENLYHGTNDWLFYREGTDSIVQLGSIDNVKKEQVVKALTEFQNELAKRDIILILLPIPTKALIYPEKLNKLVKIDEQRLIDNYSQTLREVLGRKFYLFDPSSLISEMKKSELVYQPRDSHWTPQCVSLVARELSAYLLDFEIVEKPLISIFKNQQENVSGIGDLQRIFDFGRKTVESDTFTINVIKRRYKNIENLPKQVLLLGDSFTNIYSDQTLKWGESAGLAEQLSYYLNSSVDKIAVNDNSSFVTRERLSELVKNGSEILSGKKVVIYQFSARELVFGNWKNGIDYDFDPSTQFSDADTPTITFKGKILSSSKIPSLSDISPYENALVVNRYKISKLIRGRYEDNEIYVKEWAIKNGLKIESTSQNEEHDKQITVVDAKLVKSIHQHYLSNAFVNNGVRYYYHDKDFTEEYIQGLRYDLINDTVQVKKIDVLTDFDWELKGSKIRENLKNIDDIYQNYGGKNNWIGRVDTFRKNVLSRLTNPDSSISGFFYSENGYLFSGRSRFVLEDNISFTQNGAQTSSLESIISTKNELKKRNIDLIVLPVPTRVELYPEEFNDDFSNTLIMPARYEFFKTLNLEGVETVDVLPYLLKKKVELDNSVSLKLDPHWSQFAIKEVAKLISLRLKEYSFYSELEKTKFEIDESVESLPQALVGEIRRKGYKIDFSTPNETISRVRDYFVKQASIFDSNSPYLFVGDSYLGVFGDSGGLCAHVAYEMEVSLEQFVRNGGGPIVPRGLRVLDEGGGLENRRVVIWVFVSRYLGTGMDSEWIKGKW